MDNNIPNSLFIFVSMEQETLRKQYCQSCGMPLRFDVEEYLGTNADHSRSDEYCYYCLKDGEYIVDIPMEQMVDIWVKYTDKYNEYSSTSYTPQDLRILLNKRLPTLKRWKQKEITRNVHNEAVGKIKAYIDQNLNTVIDVNELCRISNLSFFHLRRVFKDMIGENIGSYIQRLRLEGIAHKLILTNLTINGILEQTAYQTNASLAKAFKKHFGLSMTEYRERFYQVTIKESSPQIAISLQPQIKKLDTQTVISYPVERSYKDRNNYLKIWEKIVHYREKYIKKEDSGKYVSISRDNPQVTVEEQCRFYLGVFITGEYKPRGKFSIQEIPGGYYAVFRHKGSYAALPELYRSIYEDWLPQSNYAQSNSISFEVYQNEPRYTDMSEWTTDIYIPIEKRK